MLKEIARNLQNKNITLETYVNDILRYRSNFPQIFQRMVGIFYKLLIVTVHNPPIRIIKKLPLNE